VGAAAFPSGRWSAKNFLRSCDKMCKEHENQMLYNDWEYEEEPEDLYDEQIQAEIDREFAKGDKRAKEITEDVMRDFDKIIEWIREMK
jgi:hypothetical protein